MSRFKIVAFEGINGSGKTTLMEYCAQHFESLGKRVKRLNIIEDPFRSIVKSKGGYYTQRELITMFRLSEANTAKRISQLPSMIDIVFLDRRDWSRMVYQDTAGQEQEFEAILEAWMPTCLPAIDLTVFVDEDPLLCMKRRQYRISDLDHFETENFPLERCYHERYLNVVDMAIKKGEAVYTIKPSAEPRYRRLTVDTIQDLLLKE